MQKFFVMAVFLIAASSSSHACSACGCGSPAGGGSLGMMSQYNQNFVGLAWEYKGIESRTSLNGEYNSSFKFNTVELMAKYFPLKKRVFVSTIVPYNFYSGEDNVTTTRVNGLGDITLSVGYLLLKPADSVCGIWSHSLAVSSGIKLPTGKFELGTEDAFANQYLQPGTGSWDVLFNAAYTFKYKKFGIFSEANYRVNTTNKDGYKFGNHFSTALSAFYRLQAGKFSFLPAAGMFFETAGKEQINGVSQYKSGGTVLFATLGGNVYYRKVGVGLSWMQPAYQEIAAGFAKGTSKWIVNFSIIFQSLLKLKQT